MKDNLVSVIDAAKEVGQNKSHVFKILGRLGIESVKQKNKDANGQKIAYITQDEYNRVKDYLSDRGKVRDSEVSTPTNDVGGVFYLIQLEPEHDPCRVKVGFATSIEERLRSHRTAAPYSKVLKTWPCKLRWEKTAIDCVCQECEQIYTEVFRGESLDRIQSRCEEFFSLMPSL